ncbi:MAG: recombination-associated protein RdgC [Candidatus Sumerlaeota bacterium]|nr:recombination-associated protein RdgC [Candidatus Sumerlaeota bacterium]
MPFVSGTVSCLVYRVLEPPPRDFHEKAQKALARFAFKPINAARGEDRANGWVNPLDVLAQDIKLDRLLHGEFLFLGVRIDRKSPNRTVLNARIQATIAERLKDGQRKRLSADERRAIQSEARAKLLAETSPSTSIYEMLWNYDAGWLYSTATSVSASNEFLDLFASTFELEISPMLPLTYAQTWAEEHKLSDALDAMAPGNFGHARKIHLPEAQPFPLPGAEKE